MVSSEKIQSVSSEADLDQHYALLQQSLKEDRRAETTFAMAELNLLRKRYNDAVYFYEETIKIDATSHQSYARIAELLLQEGHPLQALDYYGLAIRHGADVLAYKKAFVALVSHLQLRAFNADLKDLVWACLQTDDLDKKLMGSVWRSLLRFDPAFKDVYKTLVKDSYDDFRKTFSRLNDKKALLNPFFIEGVRKLVVFDPEFERALGYLRRYCLENVAQYADYASLAEALSCYALETEYIWPTSKDEQALLQQGNIPAALRGCYVALFHQPDAQALKAQLSDDLVQLHFTAFEEQTKIRGTIPSALMEDRTSLDVQAQYEAFPYPRWRHFSSGIRDESIEGFLREGMPRILIAGCGTGGEAIEMAVTFPHAHILAVDLSLTSLSYAVMKARELGIENVEFRQADILTLAEAPGSFDFIVSTGVLHHMREPQAGLAVLTKLLKPDGVMRLALYSELARQAIVEAHAVIAQEGYTADADGIRRFRQDAKALLRMNVYGDICGFVDYYYLSECRDLLFHVQEHRFTVDGLRDLLAGQALRFMRMRMPSDALVRYLKDYPDDPMVENLDHCAAFEMQNPRTFREMYRFWVKKTA